MSAPKRARQLRDHAERLSREAEELEERAAVAEKVARGQQAKANVHALRTQLAKFTVDAATEQFRITCPCSRTLV
jgi:hypothetical protein